MTTGIVDGIRDKLNKHFGASVLALILLIAGTLAFSAYFMGYIGGKGRSALSGSKAFFIDEESGDLEVLPASEIAPLRGKAGRLTVVRAHFFTSSTDDARKLIYLERYTPEGKLALEATRSGHAPTIAEIAALRQGPQVRASEPNSPWYFVRSAQGRVIMSATSTIDPDTGKIREVFPN